MHLLSNFFANYVRDILKLNINTRAAIISENKAFNEFFSDSLYIEVKKNAYDLIDLACFSCMLKISFTSSYTKKIFKYVIAEHLTCDIFFTLSPG